MQADPFRWGHAYIPGYTPPSGRPTTPTTPNVSHPNLDGVHSPQTIYQSAQDGVPIAGRVPAPAGDSIVTLDAPRSAATAVTFDVNATGPGTAHVFLWAGDHGAIPVFLTSCPLAADPAPDYGFSACAVTDGGIPPWSPDMSGRVIAIARRAHCRRGDDARLDPARRGARTRRCSSSGSALVSFETPADEVQAFALDLMQASALLAGLHTTIAGFGLDRPLANQLDDKVTKVESELAKGKDGCPKLDDLLHATIDNAGSKGLSYAEAVQLLDRANTVGARALVRRRRCRRSRRRSTTSSGSSATIDGMGLKKPEADGLFDKTREAAHAVVDGPSSKACQKLADLAAKIAADTGKKDKLTAAQGATLSAAVAAIRTELGC